MQLELKIDVPEDAADALRRIEVTPLEYANEVLRAHFETLALGEAGKIENRPDWQGASLAGRAEVTEGLGGPGGEGAGLQQGHANTAYLPDAPRARGKRVESVVVVCVPGGSATPPRTISSPPASWAESRIFDVRLLPGLIRMMLVATPCKLSNGAKKSKS